MTAAIFTEYARRGGAGSCYGWPTSDTYNTTYNGHPAYMNTFHKSSYILYYTDSNTYLDSICF